MDHYKRPENREKGVLLPVFSLPSRYGIGCFSQEAKEFIDWLARTGHMYWQILPLNPTGMADSPYQPLSSFAGHAYFIDPVQLVDQGLLTQTELDDFFFGDAPERVDYEMMYDSRMEMLWTAYRRFAEKKDAGEIPGGMEAWDSFLADNAFWLEDYALFMALREEYGKELSWDEWPDPLRCRDAAALVQAREQYAEAIGFYRWSQFEFYRQWGELKAYANAAGVKIIGDMPVYVSYDSADCWADPGQFQLDEDLQPTMIAGVPPDQFSAEGQLWGNPLYDWEKMRRDGYAWWVSRIRQSFVLYDVIRLDHFRGYEAYYSCEAGAPNGLHGIWRKGPGMDLFRQLEVQGIVDAKELSDRFIAEDLGFLTEDVHRLLRDTGFAGTKVLQFAFDGDPDNLYLPENYRTRCVVYTGTHDNDTTAGWFRQLSQNERAGILEYLGYSGIDAWWLVLESDAAKKRGERLNTSVSVCRETPEGTAQAAGHQSESQQATGRQTAGQQALTQRTASHQPTDQHTAACQSADPQPADQQPAGMKGRPFVKKILDENGAPDPAVLVTQLLIEKAMDSTAKIAIIQLQDYLELGSEARVNVPGTIVNNWCWRVTPNDMRELQEKAGRL